MQEELSKEEEPKKEEPTPTEAPKPEAPKPAKGTGLEPNVAAALSYALGLVTGIVFLLIEKDKFVRFHAIQSIIFSIAWIVFWQIIVWIFIWIVPVIIAILSPLIWIVGVILWIVLMVKAYQGEKFKLPVIGDIAEKNA